MELLKKLMLSAGVSGFESQVAEIMADEFRVSCDTVTRDSFGNVIARKGKGKRTIMLAAHMDEIGFVVKHISKEGFLYFIKIGGIDDRILLGQRVMVCAKKGNITGVIGAKPPHLLKEEERKHLVKYEDMFIDIGAQNRADALSRVAVGDQVVFEPNFTHVHKDIYMGKAPDDRLGCYILAKVMEKISVSATVYAVATAQEEVGLKGARTSSFRINPDFAIALDTTVSGDTPGISERETALALGAGPAITIIEAGGRGLIAHAGVRDLLVTTAQKAGIAYQMDIIDGGMTDGAMIAMNRQGIPTATISIPCRYIHAPTGVFNSADVSAAIELLIKTITFAAKHISWNTHG